MSAEGGLGSKFWIPAYAGMTEVGLIKTPTATAQSPMALRGVAQLTATVGPISNGLFEIE
ncbi:hypothetical protein GCM10017655_05230 [Pseudomonas turukhanskensis]|uniref:Uncharacterized protein n=1 Tax=Pseudomonas turukhanskensis TaxID=1806536 RepID=A0A9W6NED5_9PSED|nr:hypothetical protein GCM10017655_05230 [Pseudomonas turukhanskensis]